MPSLSSKSKIGFSILFFVLLLGLGEMTLRLIGYQPHQQIITALHAEPANALLPHHRYGLTLNPGKYQVHINSQLKYQAHHLADSSRWTANILEQDASTLVHFYGCSFTYGMGVNDAETFPALFAEQHPNTAVKNFAAPGYGTVHALLQLQQHLAAGRRPNLVVLGYTSLQDARNQLSGLQQKYWRETLAEVVRLEDHQMRFPYAQIKDDQLTVDFKAWNSFEVRWSLSQRFVLADLLEKSISNIWYGFQDKFELTTRIVQAMAELCYQHQIRFIVLGLDKSDSLDHMQKFCEQSGIHFTDAGIDLADGAMNLMPHDSHPNAAAHLWYAAALEETHRDIGHIGD